MGMEDRLTTKKPDNLALACASAVIKLVESELRAGRVLFKESGKYKVTVFLKDWGELEVEKILIE